MLFEGGCDAPSGGESGSPLQHLILKHFTESFKSEQHLKKVICI